MRLTPELFEQITGCKESALERVGGRSLDDPRSAARLPLAFRTVACRLTNEGYGRPVPVHVCDISVLGIGLTHAADVSLGKKFAICMKARTDEGGLIPLQCETVNARPVGKALMRLGATFAAVEDMHALLRALAPRPTAPAEAAPPALAGSGTTVAHAGPSAPAAAAAAPGTTAVAPAAPPNRPLSMADEIKRIRDAMLS